MGETRVFIVLRTSSNSLCVRTPVVHSTDRNTKQCIYLGHFSKSLNDYQVLKWRIATGKEQSIRIYGMTFACGLLTSN